MTEKRDDVITVTVSAPAGKRALVHFSSPDHNANFTVPQGTSQSWFIREADSVTVMYGDPHATVASDVKPE